MTQLQGQRHEHHVVATLDYLEAVIKRQGQAQNIIEQDGKAVSLKAALAYIQELRGRGYRYAPACDSVAPDGGCAGHRVEAQAVLTQAQG